MRWFGWMLCVVMAGSGVSAAAQTVAADVQPPLEASLLKAINDYDEAQLHGDRAALERLVADDYLIVRTGGVGDKASLIRNVAAPVKTDPFTIVQPFTRNYGTTVITGGWCDLHGTDGGKPWSQKMRFADVWAKRGRRWFVVMTTLTPSDKP